MSHESNGSMPSSSHPVMERIERSNARQLSTSGQNSHIATLLDTSIGSSGHGPAPGHSADQTMLRSWHTSSFFQNSSGVETTGGQFVNATNAHLHNTYHFHGHTRSGEFASDGETTLQTNPRSAEIPSFNAEPTSLPVMNSIGIYTRHLQVKGRGFPIWNPDPDGNSPHEYQRQGISIGDVGIITETGDFDFMFNICRPRDHPINVGEVPDDFKPFKKQLKDSDIRRKREFKTQGYIASSSVTRACGREKSGDNSAFHELAFEATASEGAILAIPDGANSETLRNVAGFRRYVTDNLVSWYNYMKNRDCEVKNGDIRLVIGTDKTTVWGMAVFASLRISLPWMYVKRSRQELSRRGGIQRLKKRLRRSRKLESLGSSSHLT